MRKMKRKEIKIVALAFALLIVFACIVMVMASPAPTLNFFSPPTTPALDTSITLLNSQSYPSVGENGTVRFNTTGQANLTITPVNNTYFGVDIRFSELRCGDEVVYAQNDATSWYNASGNYLRKGKLYIQEIQNIHGDEYYEYVAY